MAITSFIPTNLTTRPSKFSFIIPAGDSKIMILDHVDLSHSGRVLNLGLKPLGTGTATAATATETIDPLNLSANYGWLDSAVLINISAYKEQAFDNYTSGIKITATGCEFLCTGGF